MKKRTGVLVAGVMVLCAVGTPMMADGQPGVPIDPNPFLALLPALRTAPAPGWVKLGTRLTYESSASSSPGHVQCHEEPNGEWKDDQGRVCPEGSGIGRRGLTQVTVVALDQQVAVLDLQIYALTNGTGPAVTSGYMGGIGVPGAGVDWWLNPQVLGGAVGLSAPGLKVLKLLYPVGGREYTAVRFQTWDQTANQAWVFDSGTGILLHTGSAQVARGATILSQNTLLGVRTPSVPWALLPAPDWVHRTSFLRYEGSTTFYVPGAAPASVPIRSRSSGRAEARIGCDTFSKPFRRPRQGCRPRRPTGCASPGPANSEGSASPRKGSGSFARVRCSMRTRSRG